MSAGLFLSETHPVCGRSAAGDAQIVADAWVYNRVANPPPAAAECVSSPGGFEPGAHTWSLRWSGDGESVAVLSDGVPLACILGGAKPGYSRFLHSAGPWGRPWDSMLYERTFADAV